MAANKRVAKRKPSGKARRSSSGKKKTARKPSSGRRTTAKRGQKAARKRRAPAAADRVRGSADLEVVSPPAARGLGPEAGGQAGDTEGLSRSNLADSESVEELIEEGQAFEAGVISGVENAPDADEGEVQTRQVSEDDVPQEYLDED